MAALTRTVMRREADRLQQAHGDVRFRRRSGMDADESRSLTDTAVLAARGGDDDGLRFLYVRYADGVYSHALSILHNAHDAEDVTQAVFVKLPARLQRYRPQTVPFASWILRVTHNAAIDHIRGQRAVPSEVVVDAEAAGDDEGERLDALRVALSRLPESSREVVFLRFVAGLSPNEVAERTGRTEKAVHALQHRARKQLRQELEALEAAPSARAPRAA